MLALAVAVGEIITLRFFPRFDYMVVGELIVPVPPFRTAIFGIIPPMLVGAASFAINDYFDLKSDRINKRFDRPLVSGKIKPRNALLLSLFLFLLGILLSFFINLNCFLLTLSFSVLAYLYSFRLKDIAVVGNIYIALTMAVPFIYGSFVIANVIPAAVLLLSSIAFLTGFAREIMITARDVKGDKAGRGSKTLPMIVGVRNSLYVSSFLYIIGIALSAVPYLYIDHYQGNLVYAVPVLVNDILLAYIALYSLKKTSKEFMKLGRNLSLAAMFIALLGFLGALLV